MTEPLRIIVENSLQIAWDFLEATGEIEDPHQTAEILLGAIKTLVLRGEHRMLILGVPEDAGGKECLAPGRHVYTLVGDKLVEN